MEHLYLVLFVLRLLFDVGANLVLKHFSSDVVNIVFVSERDLRTCRGDSIPIKVLQMMNDPLHATAICTNISMQILSSGVESAYVDARGTEMEFRLALWFIPSNAVFLFVEPELAAGLEFEIASALRLTW